MHRVAFKQHDSGHRDRGLPRVRHGQRHQRREHHHRSHAGGVLQRRCRPEVHPAAELLLVDAACGDAEKGHHQQQDDRVDSTDHHQPPAQAASTASTPSTSATHPPPRQALAEERRRQQRGDDGVHRDDHRTQDGGRAMQQGQVKAGEQQALSQQSADQHMHQRAACGPCHPGDQCPAGEDGGGQPEPENQHRHRGHRRNRKRANRIAKRIQERQHGRGAKRHGRQGHNSHGCD